MLERLCPFIIYLTFIHFCFLLLIRSAIDHIAILRHVKVVSFSLLVYVLKRKYCWISQKNTMCATFAAENTICIAYGFCEMDIKEQTRAKYRSLCISVCKSPATNDMPFTFRHKTIRRFLCTKCAVFFFFVCDLHLMPQIWS